MGFGGIGRFVRSAVGNSADAIEDATHEPAAREPAKMEPGQFELRQRAYAPFETFGSPDPDAITFTGDARGPSARLDVTSRETETTVVDTNGWDDLPGITVVSASAYCDPTHAIIDGVYEVSQTATPRMRESSIDLGDSAEIRMHVEANMPLLPGTPDIDLDSDVWVARRHDRLYVDGKVTGDQFPNAESLITDARGQTLLLHHYETDAGDLGPLYRLWGAGGEPMGEYHVAIQLDREGNFAGVVDPTSGRVVSVDEWNRRMLAA